VIGGAAGALGGVALVAVDERAAHPLGEAGRAQHEVDPQPTVAFEALPVVVLLSRKRHFEPRRSSL
jgi:hypothetical protein